MAILEPVFDQRPRRGRIANPDRASNKIDVQGFEDAAAVQLLQLIEQRNCIGMGEAYVSFHDVECIGARPFRFARDGGKGGEKLIGRQFAESRTICRACIRLRAIVITIVLVPSMTLDRKSP